MENLENRLLKIRETQIMVKKRGALNGAAGLNQVQRSPQLIETVCIVQRYEPYYVNKVSG